VYARRTGIAFVLTAVLGQGQTQGPSSPAFEVASIKIATAQGVRGPAGGPGTSDPTRYSFKSASLRNLIAIAFHVDFFQILGSVPTDQEYDLVANVPVGATRDQLRAMLKTLLSERFHLKAHMEQRPFPVYELVVAKGGSKLDEGTAKSSDAAPEGFPELPGDRPGISSRNASVSGFTVVRMRARRASVAELAQRLHPPDEHPILDKTGLTGKYDFTFEYATEQPSRTADTQPREPVAADLYTALRQQLGLQLVSKKVPFDVVVVDSVDKVPSAN
jgi:uncharacterized protein (TIGR03435 family)